MLIQVNLNKLDLNTKKMHLKISLSKNYLDSNKRTVYSSYYTDFPSGVDHQKTVGKNEVSYEIITYVRHTRNQQDTVPFCDDGIAFLMMQRTSRLTLNGARTKKSMVQHGFSYSFIDSALLGWKERCLPATR